MGKLQRVMAEQPPPDPPDQHSDGDNNSVDSDQLQPPTKKVKKTRMPKGLVLSMLDVHGIPYQPAGRTKQNQIMSYRYTNFTICKSVFFSLHEMLMAATRRCLKLLFQTIGGFVQWQTTRIVMSGSAIAW
jgi:hypothetical protein